MTMCKRKIVNKKLNKKQNKKTNFGRNKGCKKTNKQNRLIFQFTYKTYYKIKVTFVGITSINGSKTTLSFYK